MGSEPITIGNGNAGGQVPELAATFFYHSSADPIPHFWEFHGIYERANEEALGEEANDTGEPLNPELLDRSRCFNCGDPGHKVTECRFRLNRELIALSRQYYQFYQGNLGLGNWQRIHAVEAWRQQRLNWLEEFEPGKIKGDLLQRALESSNEEWLRNISVWGYPLGWVNETDPRERVKARIWNEVHGDVDDELDEMAFEIHGDADYVEKVSFQDAFQITYHIDKVENDLKRSPGHTRSLSDSSSSSSSSEDDFPVPPTPVRWAHYPPSYFSSQHLIPYKPPPPLEPWSSTLFEDTDAYLNQFNIYYLHPPPPPPSEEPPPLPPSSTPPPLPPSLPMPLHTPPPPPLPQIENQSYPPSPSHQLPIRAASFPAAEVDQAELSECDMDLSDSD